MIRGVLDKFYEACGYLAAAFMVGIGVSIVAQIVARMRGVTLDATEAAGLCLAASTFFGLAHTFRRGGHVRIKGDVSSQFLSGLLLAAPFARGDVTLELDGPLVSWPYVFMTARMLRQWGFRVRHPDEPGLDVALQTNHRQAWGARVGQIRSGLRFEVLFIPGHSPGHVVFLQRGRPCHVFGGDVLFRGSIGRSDFPGGDLEALLSGIREKLYTLPDDTVVYPGHGPVTTTGHEKRTNQFVRAGRA